MSARTLAKRRAMTERALSPDMLNTLRDLARWTSDGETVDQRDYHTGTLRALWRRKLLEVTELGQIRITEAGKQRLRESN